MHQNQQAISGNSIQIPRSVFRRVVDACMPKGLKTLWSIKTPKGLERMPIK